MHDSRSARRVRGKAPYFFLSYAPAPVTNGDTEAEELEPDKDVEEFHSDLIRAVAGLSGSLAPPSLGYLDATDRGGPAMARALQRSHCFVPLITPRYFTDGYCGRQWTAFETRSRRGARIPVLWTPVPTTALPLPVDLDLPAPGRPVAPMQVEAEALRRYTEGGLYGLRQYPGGSDYYDQCVRRIAQCIVQAAHRSPEPAPGEAEFAELDVPDAFATTSWHRLGIAVLAPDIHHLPPGRSDTKYGHEPRDWQPFSDGLSIPLVERTAELARNLGFAPEIRTYDEAEDVFLGRSDADSPWVLIIDPWTLHDRGAVERLRAFDAQDLPWVTVLTAFADDPQTRRSREKLGELLQSALPRRLSRGRAIQRWAVAGLDHSEAFNSRFVELADSAAQQYLNRPLRSSTSPSASADSQGDQEAQP
ncbi:FxsC protein [Streptomyces sp. NBC_00028]|uniref:FxsC protein n=1 Tax=Streptomyces sp. NBC_00028 TaxID=2975624 RepID=UPI003255CA29